MTMPGTRWVARKGPHAGSEVEIVKLTGGNRVVVRHIGGEGAAWKKDKSEAAGLATLGRDVFLGNYVQKDRLVTNGTNGGRSFRRYGGKADVQEEVAELMVEAAPKPKAPAKPVQSIEEVTPALAQSWLDRGGPNRKLSERRVAQLTRTMQRGAWLMTGEPIILDGEGRVRDGAHRLNAVVRSGVTIETAVTRGVSDAAFDVMGTGASRSAADILGIHGLPNRIPAASTARGLLIMERYGRPYATAREPEASPTGQEILQYTLAHQDEVMEAVNLAQRIYHQQFIGGTSTWAIAIALMLRRDPEAAREFVDKVIEGDNLARDSAILKLRNITRSTYTAWGSSNKDREALTAIVIKAWNFWRRGEGISRLAWRAEGRNAEDFPVVE